LNSTSFMGGACKIWSTSKLGLENNQISEETFGKQDFSDGQLEFVSFRSELELGLEKMIPGQSSKLTQGSGPFMLNFKHNPDTQTQTFFQLDGEFYKMHNPKSIKVCKT
jgi:hypothetical protein